MSRLKARLSCSAHEPDMPNRRMPRGAETIAFVVVTIITVGAMGLTSMYYPSPSTQTLTTETTRTCTVAGGGAYILYCSDPLRVSAISGANGSWNFTASISANLVSAGRPIILMATLTNIAGDNRTIKKFVIPYINPGVYDANGTEVWAWNPPQIVSLNMTITKGESISQYVTIPTSGLISGTYVIKVEPLSIQLYLLSGETLALPFSVQ